MRRVLKPGGIASFLTITYPSDLSDARRIRAVALGSDEGQSGPGYEVLMAQAGFDDVTVVDMTPEYRDTLQAITRAWQDESAGIIEAMGKEEFDERMQRRERSLIGVDEGLHVRLWVTGRAPR